MGRGEVMREREDGRRLLEGRGGAEKIEGRVVQGQKKCEGHECQSSLSLAGM